jgi:hypothetical protein
MTTYINVTNWSIVGGEKSLAIYSKVDNKCRITKYKIIKYDILENQTVRIVSNQYKIDNGEFQPCDIIFTYKIGDHSYIDKKKSYINSVPNTLNQSESSCYNATFNNVIKRLKSIY